MWAFYQLNMISKIQFHPQMADQQRKNMVTSLKEVMDISKDLLQELERDDQAAKSSNPSTVAISVLESQIVFK